MVLCPPVSVLSTAPQVSCDALGWCERYPVSLRPDPNSNPNPPGWPSPGGSNQELSEWSAEHPSKSRAAKYRGDVECTYPQPSDALTTEEFQCFFSEFYRRSLKR